MRRGDPVGHRDALERFDHDGDEHVAVDRLAVVEAGPDSRASGIRMNGAAPARGQVASMRRISSHDIVLCCISNQMKIDVLP